MQQTRNVAVIGAGPGGLAAAMLLAAGGAKVTLYEKRSVVGGRTSAVEADGFRFDMGPTFFLYPQVLEQVFEAAGYNLHAEVDMVRLDPQYHVIFEEGGDVRATGDVQRMKAQLARIDERDAAALDGYLADNRRKFEAFRPILQKPFNSARDMLDGGSLKSLPLIRPWASVDRDLRRHFRDPRTRLAFSFQSKYLGMSPFRCPSLFTILAFLEYEYGVYHPIGGCSAVMDAMSRVIREMGVDLRLGEPIDELVFEGRRATGVKTAAGTERYDAVVVNADFGHAMRHLVPDRLRRRWTDRKIERKKYSCSTYMMYLGIEGEVDNLEHHTIYLAGDYRENLADIEKRHVLSDNPSFYVQNASRTDPTLAPEGMSTLYCLAPVSHEHENIDWSIEKHRFREVFLRQLGKLGLDGIERRIRHETVFTPRDWRTQMGVYRGATFNLAHSFDQMLHLRPRNRFEDVDGVYLVGGGTHPGSGLPVIFESAWISTRLLLEDLGLKAPRRSQRPGVLPPLPVEALELA